MVAIKKIIKDKIEEKGISAHALEKMAGLKPSAVQNILYGRSKNPSISTIQAIANALGCSVTSLISGQDDESSSKASDLPWSQPLFLKCFDEVKNQLDKYGLTAMNKEEILSLVEEVYHYSQSNGIDTADANFTKWIIFRGR